LLGIGTKIRLYLPRATEETPAAISAQPAPAAAIGGSEAILLVDDNRILLTMTRRHLEALGYRVVTAASGPAALAILESGEMIDLLFTDIVMPEGMSGYKLAEAATRLRPGLKVLYASGFAAEPPQHDGQRILRKPYDRRDLAQTVRAALDG
jgi:CheY-like chemotaxis protein